MADTLSVIVTQGNVNALATARTYRIRQFQRYAKKENGG